MDWGYYSTSGDGECLIDWVAKGNFTLLCNPNDAYSLGLYLKCETGHLNTETNPDLALMSAGKDRLKLDRHTLEMFFGSQGLPSLIVTSKNLAPSQVSHINVGISVRATGICTALSQTSFFKNYHP